MQAHWREVDYMTNPLTIEQVLVYSEAYGFFTHQVTADVEEYCCFNGTTDPDANQCDILHCTSPGNPLPILTIPSSDLAPDVRMVLRSLDALFTSLQVSST